MCFEKLFNNRNICMSQNAPQEEHIMKRPLKVNISMLDDEDSKHDTYFHYCKKNSICIKIIKLDLIIPKP